MEELRGSSPLSSIIAGDLFALAIKQVRVVAARAVAEATDAADAGAAAEQEQRDSRTGTPPDSEQGNPAECPEYTPPTVRVKSMVATRRDAESLGKTLAAAARVRGFYGAGRRRSWPMEPSVTGQSRSSGSAILSRSSISSTCYRMCSPRQWPGGRLGRAGECMCGGLAWCGRGVWRWWSRNWVGD